MPKTAIPVASPAGGAVARLCILASPVCASDITGIVQPVTGSVEA